MKNISIKIVVLLTGLIIGVNAVGASDLPDCPSPAYVDRHDCFGALTDSDGVKYVGGWKDGKYNGQGDLTYVDNVKYVGEFRDGKSNGKGATTYVTGSNYVGYFRDGERIGRGIYTAVLGDMYIMVNGKIVRELD